MHELEFLGLLAFLAREAISLRGIASAKAGKKFSPNDLEMAYAFQNKHNRQGGLRIHSSPPRPPPEDLQGIGSRHVSPQHGHHSQNVPHYQLQMSPRHPPVMMGGGVQQQQQQGRGFGVDFQKEAAEWQESHAAQRGQVLRVLSQNSPRHDGSALGQSMLSESRPYQQEEHPVRQSALLGAEPPATRYSMSPQTRESHPVSMLAPSNAQTAAPSVQQGRYYVISGSGPHNPPLGGRLADSIRGQGPLLESYQSGRQAVEESQLSGNNA